MLAEHELLKNLVVEKQASTDISNVEQTMLVNIAKPLGKTFQSVIIELTC